MTNQYEPFLPQSFDPEDPDLIQVCMDRLNPMLPGQDDYIDTLERHHMLCHLQGQTHGDPLHDLVIAKWVKANEDRERLSMAVWS